ncbi:hypothetical protein CIFRMA203M1_11485 [Citrobacter freundii]|uniref:hypothetical protein n=1 Tax=Citrobacter freundii TaxID=546 RepID=UPI003B272AE9
MKGYLILAAFTFSLSAHAAGDFVQNVKDIFQHQTHVDYVDWYNKGDTAFAEYDGLNYGVYQHLKTSVRKDEINIKMQFISGDKRPDSDDFARVTSDTCYSIFASIIFPQPQSSTPVSWADDEVVDKEKNVLPSPLSFLLISKLDEAYNETKDATVNGWHVQINRIAMTTTCSARKINPHI